MMHVTQLVYAWFFIKEKAAMRILWNFPHSKILIYFKNQSKILFLISLLLLLMVVSQVSQVSQTISSAQGRASHI